MPASSLPARTYGKLNAFLAMALQDASDTDIHGVVARLDPAVGELYAHTPGEAHAALTEALVDIAADYTLAEEMIGITRMHSQAADEEEDEGEDAA